MFDSGIKMAFEGCMDAYCLPAAKSRLEWTPVRIQDVERGCQASIGEDQSACRTKGL